MENNKELERMAQLAGISKDISQYRDPQLYPRNPRITGPYWEQSYRNKISASLTNDSYQVNIQMTEDGDIIDSKTGNIIIQDAADGSYKYRDLLRIIGDKYDGPKKSGSLWSKQSQNENARGSVGGYNAPLNSRPSKPSGIIK